MSSIQDEIIQFFDEELNIEVPSVDTDLVEEGLLDSLTFVQLLFHFEQQYGIEMDLEELEIDTLRSVERIANFLMSQDGMHRAG